MNVLPAAMEAGSVEGGTESREDREGDRDARGAPGVREGKDCN